MSYFFFSSHFYFQTKGIPMMTMALLPFLHTKGYHEQTTFNIFYTKGLHDQATFNGFAPKVHELLTGLKV
jgi:hypothetical protein